ncbi:IclR family transcriptional regulator [Natronolimnohabitans sp. A-GB9]|uniref:IclR family transcriptional regulator n=1 Tax=Natronolimnohabitans sp. A-GB9 TaxID=3069757 RepID=UPI0027B7D150|nr:IclR family transcriptional regulator [Natronolimnohabitans sp. A-GB9]MDQ2052690.1 IclR family transcriptional regulator [Natronolimnohabitans sp. A-GB9]
MSDTASGSGTVKAAGTVVDIIETVSELEQATLTELSDELDMPRSTLHGYLTTLVEQNYLRKEDNQYALSLQVFTHGARAQRMNPLYRESKQFLKQMADQTKEIAWLVVEEYGRGICLRKAKGELAVQPYKRMGARISLHDTAAGKAILAQCPESRVRSIADEHELAARTENTITDVEELLVELETVRDRGVAFNDEESIEGFRAVASPVSSPDGRIGAVVVSGPKNRLQGDRFTESIPEIVSGAANALELELSSTRE